MGTNNNRIVSYPRSRHGRLRLLSPHHIIFQNL